MPLSDKDLLAGNPAPVPNPVSLLNPALPSDNPVFPNSGLFENPAASKSGGPSLDVLMNVTSKSKNPVGSEIISVQQRLDNARYSQYSPFDDNEEIYGQGQSAINRWANGLVKFGVTAAGTFAQGLMTIPDTISAIKSGKISDMYNSDLESATDEWLKNIEDAFPNYYTKWEKEHPFKSAIPFSGGAANFWADKVVKNLGFTVGAIGSAVAQDAAIGFATGGIGDIPLVSAQVGKAALWLNKIFTNTQSLNKLFSTATELGATGKQLFTMERLVGIAAQTKIADKGRYLLNLYGSARTEAGVEARQSYNDLKKEFTEDFVDKHGYSPAGLDAERIEQYAISASNARFGLNMALLSVSNMVQFDSFLKPFKSAQRAASTLANGESIAANSIDDIVSRAPKNIGGKVWEGFKKVVPNLISEGVYEEGGQFAGQTAVDDFYRRKYNGEIKGTVDDMLSSSYKGLQAQFGSDEGLENMFLGALTGGIFGAGGKVLRKARGIKDTTTSDTLSVLNSQKLTGSIQGNYEDAVEAATIAVDMKTAVDKGDLFAYKNLKHDAFFNFIASSLPSGRFDVRLEQLKMLKELKADQFASMFSIEDNTDNRKTASEYINTLISKAEDIKSSWESINSVFTNPIKLNGKSTEEDVHNYQAFESWKRDLTQYASFEKDSNDRVNSIQQRVSALSPLISTSQLSSFGSIEGISGIKNRNEGLIVNRRASQELAGTVEDKSRFAKEISFLEEQNKVIDAYLKEPTGENYAKMFTNQVNFQINNESTDETNSISPEKWIPLMEYALDLNKIDRRKKDAKRALNNLTKEGGLEAYAKQREEIINSIITQQEAEKGPKQTIKLKTKDGEEELEIGTEYILGKVIKYDAKGNEVYRFPSITILAKNEDGTIKVQDKTGKIYNIPESELEDYKLGKLSDIKKNPKANYYFAHSNSIFTFNFGKGYSPKGRLEYDGKTNVLTFVYKDKKGKIKRMEVTLDQTKPKPGFKEAILRPTGKLTPAQQEAQEKADKADDSVRIQAKKAARLAIIGDLITESSENLDSVREELTNKKKELQKVEQDLAKAQEAIVNSAPKGKGNYTQAFKKSAKGLFRAVSNLSSMRDTLSEQVSYLENEQAELEFNISYFEDLSQNIGELPENVQDFVEEIEQQRNDLNTTIEYNGLLINDLGKVIDNIDGLLSEIKDFARSLIRKFNSKYSNPILQTALQDYVSATAILEDPEQVEQQAKELYRLVGELTEADIQVNEEKLKEIREKIKSTYAENDNLGRQLAAKQKVLDKFQKAVSAYKENKAYENKQKMDEKFREDFFKKQQESQNDSGTTTTNNSGEDKSATVWEDKLKDASILFTSTAESSEDWEKDPSPATARKRFFLNNVKNFPNRANLCTILITQSNQDSVGLPNFIESLNGSIPIPLKEEAISNIDKGWVVAVYVEQDPKDGSISFVDENGNKIEAPTAENMVYSTMPSIDLFDSKGNPRYRKNQETEAKAYQEAWKEKRKEILSSSEVGIYSFQVSRGTAREGEKINGSTPENHIAGTLVPEAVLENELVIEVSEGYVAHQGENIPFPAGRPVIKYKDTLQFANNRLLTEQEQNTILEALIQLAAQYKTTGEFNRQITNYLQNIVYWGKYDQKADAHKNAGRNQIYVNENFQLVIGNNSKSFVFTEENLTANAGALKNVLSLVYNNINKKTLTSKFSEPFEEIIGWKNSTPITREWSNYQTFLLSNKLPDGKTRSVEATPLTTTVRSLSANIALDTNFKQKYAILQALDLKPVIKQKPVIQQPAQQAPAAKNAAPAGNERPFTYNSEAGEINITYTIEGNKIKKRVISDATLAVYESEAEQMAKDQSITIEEAEEQLDKKIIAGFIDSLKQAQAQTTAPTQVIPASPQTSTPTVPVNTYPLAGTYNSTVVVEGFEIPFSYEITNDKKTLTTLDQTKELIKAIAKLAAKQSISDEEAYNVISDQMNAKVGKEIKALAARYIAAQNAAPTATQQPTQAPHGTIAADYLFTGGVGTILSTDYFLQALSGAFTKANAEIEAIRNKYAKQIADEGITDIKNFTGTLSDNILAEINQAIRNAYGSKHADTVSDILIKIQNYKSGLPTKLGQELSIHLDVINETSAPAAIPAGKPTIGGGLGFPQYRRVGADVEFMTSKELEEFKDWMKKNLPLIPFEVLEDLIRINPTENAWGVFEDGVIKFYKQAAKGTGYHEAFEAVWAGMLSPEGKDGIVKEFTSRKGLFSDRVSGEEVLFSEATEEQAKERIADEFADYISGKMSSKSLGQRIIQFFKDVVNFFKSFGNKNLKVELFAQINKGGFKGQSLPAGQIDPQYSKIANLTEAEAHEAVQDMSARLFSQMFRDTASLFDLNKMPAQEFFDNIKNEWIQSGFFNYLQEAGWKQVVDRTKGFLKTLRIEFDEENVATINSEGVNKNDYMSEAFYLDVKKASAYSIKILLASLLETTPTGTNNLSLSLPTPKGSSIQGYLLANYNKTYAYLLDKLSNISSLEGMLSRFKLSARENSNFVLPFVRMKGSLQAGTIDYSKLSKYDWRLLINFFSTFSKQAPIPLVQYEGTEGNYIGGGNIQNAVNLTVAEWVENIKALSKETKKRVGKTNFPLIQYNKKDKVYVVDKESFNSLPVRTVGDQIILLSHLGINFSEEMYKRFSEKDQAAFNKAVADIKTNIHKTPAIVSLSGKTIGISGPLRSLAAIQVKALAPYQATTYYDINGKKRQEYVENNAFSTFVNLFNEVNTLDELKKQFPQLNDVFSQNSQILKKGGLFFNKAGEKIKNLSVNYAHGTRIGEDGKGTTVDNLSLADRRLFEINNNIVGDYYILTPADSATEWTMNLGNTLSFNEFSNNSEIRNKIVTIFTGYLRDDINLAKENRTHLAAVAPRAQQLRFLRDILSERDVEKIETAIKEGKDTEELINSKSVRDAIIDFVESKRDARKSTLLKDGKIFSQFDSKTNIETWSYPALQTNFTTDERMDRFKMSEEALDNMLLFSETNYAINNIEFHKLFFGDPYQFDIKGNTLDELKRVKLFGSPRRTTYNSQQFNDFLNSTYNIGLKKGIPGWRNHKSFLNTTTLDDVNVVGNSVFSNLPQELKDAYEEANEADAASWIMDLALREARLKNGQWSDVADEWMEWEQAYTRRALFAKGVFIDYPKDLQADDNALLEQPKPLYPIEVIKSIVSGVKHEKGTNELIVDKFSQLPLVYSTIENTKLGDLYIKMWKEGIDYAVVKSGRKVGREAVHPVYKDGKFNTDAFNNSIQIPWSAWSILVETSYSEGKKQTRGSQATKLVTLDLMEAGVPLSPEIGQKVRRNQNALDSLTKEGYASLLKKLGLKDNGTSFNIVDVNRAYSTITNELLRREASNNFKASLQIEDGKFKYPFEASAAYIQIRNMLYSIVDKSITSPKMNGAPHVQVPATMWETEDRGFAIKEGKTWKKLTATEYEALPAERKKKVVLTSSSLKWYSEEDPYMEVLLPHWFKSLFSPNNMPSDEELLKQFTNKDGSLTEEGKKILSGIGFRIPTDALHAIENFRVKGFLPQNMGYTIVVPSEITVKAGSDFDIDKLNTYLKNVYLDANKKIRYVEYKGDKESTLAFYRNAFLEDAEIKIAKAEKSITKNTNLLATIEALESGEVSDKFYNKWSEILNGMMQDEDIDVFKDRLNEVIDAKNLDIEKLSDADVIEVLMENFAYKMYKASLENEYFDSMRELLELPENFQRLLTPTTYGTFPKLADEIKKLKGIDDGAIKGKLLDRDYMSSQRHAYIVGKNWVGIAAVHITGHSLKQRAPISIDVTKAPLKDKIWLGDGKIKLSHNTRNGSTSLSEIKDVKGNYISDTLASIGNGIVDVAKNPFILNVFRNKESLSVGLFLKEAGVYDETIGLFVNQPIIDRMYDMAESEGRKGIFSTRFIDDVIMSFGARPSGQFNENSLATNIESFYKGKFTDADNAEQVAILFEYLKYAKMSNHNFKFTQASNYDVASFLNGFDIAKKVHKTELAEDNNIITSVQSILDNSSLGVMAKYLNLSKEAMSEFFKYDQAGVKDVLESVLKPYMEDDVFMSNDEFQRMGTMVLTSFTDYLIQTKARVNNKIEELMVNTPTSIVQQVVIAKSLYPNNLILQNLVGISSDKEEGSKSIKLRVKSQEAYDDNLYEASLRELKENSQTVDLYRNIVSAALLQGSAFSTTNLSTLIPIEDYAAVLSPIINNLTNYQDLHNFVDNKAFQRANWRNNSLVPEVTPAFFGWWADTPEGDALFFRTSAFPTIKALGIEAKQRKLLYVPLEYQAREAASPVLKMKKVVESRKTATADSALVNVETGARMTKKAYYDASKKGDFSYKDYYGYMRVEDANGEPIVVVTTYKGKETHNYIYRQVNLWGDRNVREYYMDGSPSKIDNGTVRIEEELSEQAIRDYFSPEASLESQEKKPILPKSTNEDFNNLLGCI